MRTGIDKVIDNMVKAGASTEDIVDWLSDNLSTKELTERLAKTLKENCELKENSPGLMRITQKDFDHHFRIIGFRSDGSPETRGGKYNNA